LTEATVQIFPKSGVVRAARNACLAIGLAVGASGAALAVGAGAETGAGRAGWFAAAGGMVLFAMIALAVRHGLPAHDQTRFGAANTITLLRAGGICLLPALAVGQAGWQLAGRDLAGWTLPAAALMLLTLDGVDGWTARRQNLASDFGARFDMEVDALFVLMLSGLVLAAGRAGAWVLAIGLMRYAAAAAGWLWPRLGAAVPPRWSRKAVCVAVILLLVAGLMPAVSPDGATILAAVGLALLTWSFAVDIAWLLRHPTMAKPVGASHV
jgi:phosphatidylglycerophosphate synthase